MDPEAMCSDGDFSDASSDGDRLSDDDYFDCVEEDDRESHTDDDDVVVPNAVLTERDIVQRTSQEAAAMAELFSVPADWALALLVHYHWNPLRLQDDWFADQGRVLDAVGLGAAATGAGLPVPGGEGIVTCAICAEDKPAEEMASAGCAHRYCHECWRGYVAAALDGAAAARCLALRCPDASCSRAVLRGMVERFATADGRGAYARALARAYADGRRRRLKPCTAPGCGRFIEIELAPGGGGGGGGGGSDLACRCGNAFCWRCGGAPHWPASCAAVARWAREADRASADWILLHTKPCPRCRRPIERATGGCSKMVCAPPCDHFFCWGCLGVPTVGRVGEHDMCGRLPEPPATEERVRAELALDRFLYYQNLWMASLRKRRDAEAELRRLRQREEKRPPERRAAMVECHRIVAAAWEQVAEGRRVLGNACAHGQGLRELYPARQELFEYQRGEADVVVERLRRRAMAWPPQPEVMMEFGAELAKLTRVTRQHLENFAKAVEEGLPEMCVPVPASSSKS